MQVDTAPNMTREMNQMSVMYTMPNSGIIAGCRVGADQQQNVIVN